MDVVDRIKLSIITMGITILIYSLLMIKIEGLSLLDSIYFSVVTISTVGYGDYVPKTELGKAISSIFILFGVGIGLYTLGNVAEFFIGGYFEKKDRMRKMEKRIKYLRNHYIICGYGKSGKVVAKKLEKSGAKYVVIDINEKILENELENNPNFNYIVGDATHDEVLIKAKIKEAEGLISTVSRDSDNVYITLSAKRLNPNIYVVAKADEKVAMDKLLIAGADRVVSPYIIGGLRMAELALKADVLDFISTFMSIAKYEYDEDLGLKKIKIGPNSPLIGKKLHEIKTQYKLEANILGIKKDSGLIINPPSDVEISLGDIIYAFGTSDQLNNLESMEGENDQ
ncbi:NAD-binding protein [Methanothermococcus sp. SCGC AD-155-C09]|nr:NAD-binding protein [Methanothermococcus sp. SCGC AD-155-C09]